MPRLAIVAAIAVALIAVAAPRARAQIVDVQTLIGHDVPEGVSGKLEGSIDWRTGNTRLLHTGGAVVARWRACDHLVFAIARGEYEQTAGLGAPLVTDVAKDFEHLRYRWHVVPWLSTEVFAQHEADRFRRLRLRALAGAGLRLRVAHDAEWSVHVGAAYMAEYEELVDDALPDAGARAGDSRLSTYAVALVKLNDDVSASETVYVQPRFTDPRDLRLLEEAALTSKLTAHVSFKAALVLAHDSRPPPGTAKTDTSLQSSIEVSF
jgi:Protein of unknown function, DUF481